MKLLNICLLFFSLVQAPNIFACVCSEFDMRSFRALEKTDLDRVNNSIIGKVLKLKTKVIKNDDVDHTVFIVTIEVLKSQEGKIKRKKIKVATGAYSAACGYPFAVNQKYFLALSQLSIYKGAKVKFETNFCQPNHLIKELSMNEKKLIEDFLEVKL